MSINIVSNAILLIAAILMLCSLLGIIRFKNFFERLHAAGIADGLAIILASVGLALKFQNPIVIIKILLLIFILVFSNPSSTHCLIKTFYQLLKTNKNDR